MSAAEILYSFRVPYPDVIERERAQVLTLEAYRDGARASVTIAGSSFTLWKPDGTKLVDAAAITSPSGLATYSLAAPASTSTLGEGWLEEWACVMPDGTTHTVRREAAMALRTLHPPACDADILEDYPNLTAQLGSYATSFQGFLDSTWKRILRKLITDGHFSYKIMSAGSFFDAHLHGALFRAFRFMWRHQPSETWKGLWEYHESEAKAAWSTNFTADSDHDGKADSTNRAPLSAVVHVNPAPMQRVRGSGKW